MYLREAAVGDGVLQCDRGIRSGIAHEAQVATVEVLLDIDVRNARDLAAQTELFVGRHRANAGAAFSERARDRIEIITQARDDAHTGHDDSAHQASPAARLDPSTSPTRRPRAV